MEQINEIWKPCPEYENIYEVSNLGNVRNKKTGRLRAPRSNGYGYMAVELWNKTPKNKYVHRLVAGAFLGEIDGYQVNHLDGDKANNNLWNLEICTATQNQQHSLRVLGNKPGRGSAKAKNILCVETGEVFYSSLEFQRETGLDGTGIRNCLCGNAKRAWGYTWKYTDKPITPHTLSCYTRHWRH